MYRHILIPLENSTTDEAVLRHVRESEAGKPTHLTLVHVADGHAARNYEHLHLAPSQEMIEDRDYLARRQRELAAAGFTVDAYLERGDPADQIVALAQRSGCDLIAMATHGHGFFADLLFGSVSRSVRHRVSMPVLLVPEKGASQRKKG